MATKKRLIDANRLKMRMIAFATAIKREYLSIEAIVDTINTEDTVDAVEVVRCKDCKLEGTEKCPMVHRDLLFGNLYAETKPDAFCSYGEGRYI